MPNNESLVASSINLVNGKKYSTVLVPSSVVGGVLYKFDGVYITDSNNDIDYNTEIYYGNGSQWVEITPSATKIVGIEADFANNTFTRIEDSANWSAGSDFDRVKCYQRRRCNVTDDGHVTAYYGDANYTESGFTQTSITVQDGTTFPAGTEVQVMVEQPKVWYKVEAITTDGTRMDKGRYYVADGPVTGFKVHPAFIRNEVEYDNLYISAYEATLYDASESSYTGGSAITPDYLTDKLSSVKGTNLYPLTNLTRENYRDLAAARGNNWTQLTIQAHSLEQLLMSIEYCSFNLQTVLSAGNTNSSGANIIGSVTTLNSSGTGLAGASVSATNSFTWRYAENVYGDVNKYQDGLNTNGGNAYIADHGFNSNYYNTAPYVATGLYIRDNQTYGYLFISRFHYKEEFDWLLVACSTGGDGSTPINDKSYVLGSTREPRVGGCWNDGSGAGAFCFYADGLVGAVNANIGTRLCYMSQN